MKTLILTVALFGAMHCSTLSTFVGNKQEKIYIEGEGKGEKTTAKDFDIKLKNAEDGEYSVSFKDADTKEFLVITNPKTGTKWTMSNKDFKIFSIGYKNWRSVEELVPVITEIKEEGDWILFTFNYFKEINDNGQVFKTSILSGVVSINKKYIRSSKDENSKYWIFGLAGYSAVITTILFIVIL